MISTDLRLLVTVGWQNRNGQKAPTPTQGEFAAVKRLVERGLLCRVGSLQVGLTNEGERMLRLLDRALEQGPVLRKVK